MKSKTWLTAGAVIVCCTLLWGCTNTDRSPSPLANNADVVQPEGFGDLKRLEASHLEALERMEKDHIHRMVSLSARTDEDRVMTVLDRSSQKLEEMRPLAEMLQYQGHPALLQRIQEMSSDILGSQTVLAQMKKVANDGSIKIQSSKTDALQHINSFNDYHRYIREEVQTLSNKSQSSNSVR